MPDDREPIPRHGEGRGFVLPGRLQRLRDELIEEGVPALDGAFDEVAALVELSYALRPPQHEGRAVAYGAMLVAEPIPPEVLDLGPLDHEIVPVEHLDPALLRRFADGLRTFVIRDPDGISGLLCFGRAMSREYDLVILRELLGAFVVQRHPNSQVRTYGPAGVTRWDGIDWYHEAPIDSLIETLGSAVDGIPVGDLRLLMLFAVHELSPRRIGATLVWRAARPSSSASRREPRHALVPHISLARPGGPAAIANAIAQTDGAALFGPDCLLTSLGVQLVPSTEAKNRIDLVGGTRHTSAQRYSYDDPDAVVIVVSEDGPVTVMHQGEALRIDPRRHLIG